MSTRKVEAITEELCGHSSSASTIGEINKGLDAALERFAKRRLEEPYAYLILDARYEKVRIDGVIRSQAVLVAIGISWEGRYPRLTDWVEEHIGETLTFYRLPRQHHKHLKMHQHARTAQ